MRSRCANGWRGGPFDRHPGEGRDLAGASGCKVGIPAFSQG
jgi:hypothetical protein